jgi:hypothetical protein
MFIGHYAPALVVAALVRRPRLGPLFLAAQLVDFAMFVLVLAGVEHIGIQPGRTVMVPLDLWDVRWTHSLIGTLGWAAGFVIVIKLVTRDARAAWIGGAVVASHWLLDLVVHAPDLTVAGGGTRYGWALWNHPYVAMPLELLIGFLALTYYLNATRAVDWRGRAAPVVLAAAMLGVQLYQWLAPQPDVALYRAPASLSLSVLAVMTILTVLAWWTGDLRTRKP